MYTSLAKVDWKAFEYIHSSNTRDAFQKLTEQLFCFEFNQPYGVYRYFNQPHIETMPIRQGNDYIGFQSKYYDASTTLAEKESELTEAIDGAHSRYPGLNKIIFYTNKEVGMSTIIGKHAPAYVDRIVKHGASKGIAVEWRGLNELETMLLNPDNVYLRDYFFAPNGGIRKTFEQMKRHTTTIFNSIGSEILYHNQPIKISHSVSVLDSIWDTGKDITIVHGDGGCGKSGLVKDLLYDKQTYPVLLFKATDFNCPSIPEFVRKYGDCTWDDLLAAFDDAPQKLCIIDSAEKAFTMDYQDTLVNSIQTLLMCGWKLLITIRSAYLANFLNFVLRTSNVNEIHVPALSTQALTDLEKEFAFSLPTNTKLRDLLCNLFYLNMYLSQDTVSESQTTAEFFESVWQQVICKSAIQTKLMHTRRGNTICKIARYIAARGSCYYIPDDSTDWDAIAALCESDILRSDETMGGYFITHDVYEELVWGRIISQEFSRKANSVAFFASLGDSLLVRKAFRVWLHHQFETPSAEIEQFLTEVLQHNEISSIWKDDILIALMSENTEVFTQHLDRILIKENYELLIRSMHLLNTACKVIDDDLCQNLLTSDELKTNLIFRYVKPSGIGWNYLISFSYLHRESIPWSPITISLASEISYTWARHNPNGTTTRYAGLLALFLYSNVTGSKRKYHLEETHITKICDAILLGAHEIHPELSAILNNVIENQQLHHRELYHQLCNHLLENAFNTGRLCDVDAVLVIRLAKFFWVDTEKEPDNYYGVYDRGIHFGLREHTDHSYYPTSAFQTPILPLLNAAPKKTLDFIIELLDIASSSYQSSRLSSNYDECFEMEVILPDESSIKQIASDRLWLMHRGTSASSHLLDSVLMALERWLHQTFEILPEQAANSLCMKLLSQSHSAAITAVITSMVIAYPEKLFDTAYVLIRIKEIFKLDIQRLSNDRSSSFLRGLNQRYNTYDTERINSNNLAFRKKSIEDIILSYQLNSYGLSPEDHAVRIVKLYKAIDDSYTPEESLPEYARFALYRIDLRKAKLIREQNANGQEQLALVPDLPDTLIQKQKQVQEYNQDIEKFTGLQLWSTAHVEHNPERYKQYPQYENNPLSALFDGLQFVENPCCVQINNHFITYVAAALLIDFHDQLDSESFNACRKIILTHIQSIIEEQSTHSIGDGTDAAIAALPSIIEKNTCCSIQEDPLILFLMLICDWSFQRDYAIKIFREKMWQNRDLAFQIISLFIQLKPGYDKEVSKHHGISPFEFFEKHISLIKNALQQPFHALPECTELNSCALITLNLLMPMELDAVAYGLFERTGLLLWPKIFKDNRHFDACEKWPGKYEQIPAYIDWFANVLLRLDISSQNHILSDLIPCLTGYDHFSLLLTSLITVQDVLVEPSAFWNVWIQLFTAIEAMCAKEKDSILRFSSANLGPHYGRLSDEIISIYLFALPWRTGKVDGWHTLRREDSTFFTTAVSKLGYHPATLCSIACILNTIGCIYADSGIKWLSTLILDNPHLRNSNLPINTQYYIEEYAQHFCNNNRSKIKKDAEIKKALTIVLSFLVDRGSTCGYMLREKFC